MNNIILALAVYSIILFILIVAFKKFRKSSSIESYLTANSSIGPIVGFLTFSATLFSTFTLLGMPSFFKTHGVASWVFLGFTDVFMAFVFLKFGLLFKESVTKLNEKHNCTILSMSDYFKVKHNSTHLAVLVTFISTIFLLPYIAIQIKGIGELFFIMSDEGIDAIYFKLFITIMIFIYTFKSGIKSVILTDSFQFIVTFITVWAVAIILINSVGGSGNLFVELEAKGLSGLFSAPGPKGLLDYKFLISSFIVIILMPITQPQLNSRFLMIKDKKSIKLASISIAVFSFLVIIPTIIIGLFEALYYTELSPTSALVQALTTYVPSYLIVLFIIGLLSASMSTVDSQVLSLSGLFYKFFKSDNYYRVAKILTTVFLILSFYISAYSGLTGHQSR